ncbi:hypothetical protein PI125_g4545 [Phytophthora idaei]|nr:hypothetical protein PI125_g4545 [Phytophthora idaei]
MAKVKLCCGVYGEGAVFSVDLERNADVEALQKVIVNEKKNVNYRFNVDPSSLTLYLARKECEETKWRSECGGLAGRRRRRHVSEDVFVVEAQQEGVIWVRRHPRRRRNSCAGGTSKAANSDITTQQMCSPTTKFKHSEAHALYFQSR